MSYKPNAVSDAANWYTNLMRTRLPNNAFPFRWADAVNHIIGADLPENNGKSFSQMLTEAWMNDVIPGGFTQKSNAYFEQMHQRKAKYIAGVNEYGAARVHESKSLLQQLINQ